MRAWKTSGAKHIDPGGALRNRSLHQGPQGRESLKDERKRHVDLKLP